MKIDLMEIFIISSLIVLVTLNAFNVSARICEKNKKLKNQVINLTLDKYEEYPDENVMRGVVIEMKKDNQTYILYANELKL